MIFKDFGGVTQSIIWTPYLDEFSRDWSSSCPHMIWAITYKNWICSQKTDGWIFQKLVQLMPRKLKFRKNTGRVFQTSVSVNPRKTEISEKFLDEFSRIWQWLDARLYKVILKIVLVSSCPKSINNWSAIIIENKIWVFVLFKLWKFPWIFFAGITWQDLRI